MVIIGFNEAVNVFAECLATTFLLTWLGPPGGWISVPVMFVLVLLVSDITPKTFALGFPAAVARLTARPLAAVALTFHPLARLFVPEETAPAAPLSESEFKALLIASERSGQVAPAERELIDKVFAFGSRRVSEIMTPRERIFALDLDTAVDRIIAEVAHGHYSRVPVYRGNPNNIVGVLRAKDLVARRLESTPPRLERLIREPSFVPPGKTLGELFDEMRRAPLPACIRGRRIWPPARAGHARGPARGAVRRAARRIRTRRPRPYRSRRRRMACGRHHRAWPV